MVRAACAAKGGDACESEAQPAHPEVETSSYDQGGDHYPRATLVRVEVAGKAVDPLPPLTAGLAAAPGPAGEIAAQREWVFSEDEDTNTFFINSKVFDMERVDVRPKLGTIEEWTLRNITSEQHPFHIHVNDFRVLSVNGVPYDAKGEQDTVVLPPGGEVRVRIPFLDYPGQFVFHCHILAHENGGMMAVVDVVP